MKHTRLLLTTFILCCRLSHAEDVTNGLIWVTGARLPINPLAAPFITEHATRDEIAERQPQTFADIFANTPGVLLQKTAPGHGSPFIRGFTGFRNLLLVDGIRLNHSAFREGANQYWNTVEPYGLDHVELAAGGGSVLYGSDAIGGTAQAFTPDPSFSRNGVSASGSVIAGFRSATDTGFGRLEGTLATPQTAWAAGLTRRYAGDVRAGGATDVQPHTGYGSMAFDLKLRQILSSDRELVVAWHHYVLDDVWRTHRTVYGKSWKGTTVGDEQMRVTDNARDMASLQYRDAVPTAAYDTWRGTLAFQHHTEDEHTVKNNGAGTDQEFDIGTLALLAEFTRENRWGRLVYGADLYVDRVDSYRRDFNADGDVTRIAIQGPVADDARYTTLGLYGEQTFALRDRFDLILGLRGTWIEAVAGRYQNPATQQAAAFDKAWYDLTASIRAILWLDTPKTTSCYASLGRAFRAPNFSDLTRFDTARSGEIETPQPDLDPEQFYTAEIGIKTERQSTSFQAAYFYTTIRDLIVRYPTGNLVSEKVEVTKANASSGYVHGFLIDMRHQLAEPLQIRLSLAWVEGFADAFDTSTTGTREPLRALPLTGEGALRWSGREKTWWVEAALQAVAREDRLSSADVRDTQRIPPRGTPGYAVVALRCGWHPTDRVRLCAALENACDKDYRTHGSGSNEPGRSLNLTAACSF